MHSLVASLLTFIHHLYTYLTSNQQDPASNQPDDHAPNQPQEPAINPPEDPYEDNQLEDPKIIYQIPSIYAFLPANDRDNFLQTYPQYTELMSWKECWDCMNSVPFTTGTNTDILPTRHCTCT